MQKWPIIGKHSKTRFFQNWILRNTHRHTFDFYEIAELRKTLVAELRKTLVAELRKTRVAQKRNRAILREMTFANDCANCCFFAQNWCAKKEKFCVSFCKIAQKFCEWKPYKLSIVAYGRNHPKKGINILVVIKSRTNIRTKELNRRGGVYTTTWDERGNNTTQYQTMNSV